VGSGDNVLHHTHVDDVLDGILALGRAPAALNEDFILAGPETTTLRGLSELVAETLGTKLPPVHIPLPLARMVATGVGIASYRGLAFQKREPPINHEKLDVMTLPIAFDTTKLRHAGFTPRVGYREGIARTLGSGSS
jgi:nucleoside-diphosphate-sugar epimerase